ncbi:hypothetical protein SteCoe_3725 [Stentor coeruleus]|uniref:Uncharacterized protein n=1 Tax=Stentor coeruleus TaxID=5963 RepID=A0A1R2CWH8_9CILI|nr:hypothetical protein SteCoe_3725 [Stentor coeruleus]
MRKISDAKHRRFKNLSWITVEEQNEVTSFRSTQKVDKTALLSTSLMQAETENDNLTEEFSLEKLGSSTTKHIKKCSGSVIPRSSNYVNYSSSKYYCPYYIKPKYWKAINSAPRFDEKLEREKLQQFYNHMHNEPVNPNPFKKSSFDQGIVYENNRLRFAELPILKNYKTYLIEKKIRVPVFLNNI